MWVFGGVHSIIQKCNAPFSKNLRTMRCPSCRSIWTSRTLPSSGDGPWSCRQRMIWKHQVSSHRIRVGNIYLHLVDLYGKWRQIYHTWILWCWESVSLAIKKKLEAARQFLESQFLPSNIWNWRVETTTGNCLQARATCMVGLQRTPAGQPETSGCTKPTRW